MLLLNCPANLALLSNCRDSLVCRSVRQTLPCQCRSVFCQSVLVLKCLVACFC